MSPKILLCMFKLYLGGAREEEEGCQRASLVGVIQGVLHDGQKRQPCLLSCGDDLRGWQQEAIAPSVPELKSIGVLDALAVGPVNSASTGLIWGKSENRGRVSHFGNIYMGQVGNPKPKALCNGKQRLCLARSLADQAVLLLRNSCWA